jgi:putative membrane protein
MSIIKHTGVAAWFIGIAAVVGLTIWSGADLVAQALASVGWGAALVVMVRVTTVGTAGVGWWLLFSPSSDAIIPAQAIQRGNSELCPSGSSLSRGRTGLGQARPALATCVGLRFVREGINTLLPMAQVGGDLIGARLLTFRGIAGPLAAANIIVDILLQAATQFQFAVIGLMALIVLEGDGPVARGAAVGLAVAAIALLGFYFAQRRGGQRIIAAILGRLAGDRKWHVLGTVDQVFENLSAIYADRRRLATSTIVHLVGWLIGTLEVFIALALMGHEVSVAQAVVIESLTHAVRGAAFAIPGALGAQEGGLLVLCAIFGIPAEDALAVSLLKRVADVAVGVPGLVGWQVLEGARLKYGTVPTAREGAAAYDHRTSES